MPLRALALAAAVLGACALDEPTVSDRAQASTGALAEEGDGDVCDLLPSDGPCSLACDPDALSEEYVPPGTCALFLCTLDDGRMIGVHACHPAEHGPGAGRRETIRSDGGGG